MTDYSYNMFSKLSFWQKIVFICKAFCIWIGIVVKVNETEHNIIQAIMQEPDQESE